MNRMGISTDPTLLDVELPATLIESPTVSTFLPDEEASTCPLLPTTNGTSTPMTFSHPLTPCNDNDSNASANLCNEDAKVDTSSSTGSSSGIAMDAPDSTSTSLFNKHAYQHLQIGNGGAQDGNCPNGTLSKDTPSFVSWNWPLIRKCTFFAFMSSLLAMCAIVVAMIVTLPKTCNPKTAWYRGSVFYEIFPASFQDSNNDGIGDIRGIGSRVDYLASLGVSAVRLNSIFSSPHYPDDYDNVTSLTEISAVLGTATDLHQLAESLHAHNISLILDLPIGTFVKKLEHASAPVFSALTAMQHNRSEFDVTTASTTTTSSTTRRYIAAENPIKEALTKWAQLGVDGFYVKGLEKFADDAQLMGNLAEWKRLIGANRILIANERLIDELPEFERTTALHYIDLIDVHLDVLNGTKALEERIRGVLAGPLAPGEFGAWIHWSLGGVEKKRLTRFGGSRNITLAATIMQLMLPGTPNVFYGDEIALESIADPHNEHDDTRHLHHLAAMQWSNSSRQFTNRETLPWLPQTAPYSFENFQLITRMIALRNRSPSLYKNAICKPETTLPNTEVRRSHDDIFVVERVYPRRYSFVSVSNFGLKHVTMDMTSMYYSGIEMLHENRSEKIFFSELAIRPLETMVIKLDK